MSLDAINPTSAVAASSGTREGAGNGAAPTTAPTTAPAAAAAAAQVSSAPAHAAELESARQNANKALQKNGCELAFELDDASGRMIARLIDTSTKEVLRQYPSRETLAIARALAEDRSHGVLIETNA